MADEIDDEDDKVVDFFWPGWAFARLLGTGKFLWLLSPSNFVATNPEVLNATLQSGGQNLLRGNIKMAIGKPCAATGKAASIGGIVILA